MCGFLKKNTHIARYRECLESDIYCSLSTCCSELISLLNLTEILIQRHCIVYTSMNELTPRRTQNKFLHRVIFLTAKVIRRIKLQKLKFNFNLSVAHLS